MNSCDTGLSVGMTDTEQRGDPESREKRESDKSAN